MEFLRNVEALQQNRGVALCAVAVLFADDALELAEAHALLVGHRGLVVEQFALLERRPQAGVAHDDRVDHPERIEGELVLAEHAELVGPHDRALLRLELSGQSFMNVDLPAPFGPVRP